MSTKIGKTIERLLEQVAFKEGLVSKRSLIEGFRLDPAAYPAVAGYRVGGVEVEHEGDRWTRRRVTLLSPKGRIPADVMVMVALPKARHIRPALGASYLPRNTPLVRRRGKATRGLALGDFTLVHHDTTGPLDGKMIDFVVRNIAVRIMPGRDRGFPSEALARQLARAIERRADAGFVGKDLRRSPFRPRIAIGKKPRKVAPLERLDLDIGAADPCGSDIDLLVEAGGGAVARDAASPGRRRGPFFFRAGQKPGTYPVQVVAINELGLMAFERFEVEVVGGRSKPTPQPPPPGGPVGPGTTTPLKPGEPEIPRPGRIPKPDRG